MKTISYTILAVLFALSIGAEAAELQYYNTSSLDYVTGGAGPGTADGTWSAAVYSDVNDNGMFDLATDTYVAHTPLFDGDGGTPGFQGVYWATTPAGTSSDYLVVFWDQSNNGDFGSVGSYYSLSATSPYQTGATDIPYGHDFGGDGTWVLVPEPGTYALFGLGLLTVAAYRRKHRKQ